MTDPKAAAPSSLDALLEVMTRLRNPEGGCPWDLEQTFSTIAPYTVEEAYEVADAIEQKDMEALKDELGDLLFQVVFHAQLAKEQGLFDFDAVMRHVTAKMVSRHPHVFGNVSANTAQDVNILWDQRKDQEKIERSKTYESILDDVPAGLPAVIRAEKLQKRAARVGFEWNSAADILIKLEEETRELGEALALNDKDKIEDELGDVFFVLINFARKCSLSADAAIRRTNQKFIRRFKGMEKDIKDSGASLADATLDQMEQGWQRQKLKEKIGAA